MPFQVKDLPFGKDQLKGISEKTTEIHHDKLYAGYVNKRNEITEALESADRAGANQAYSPFRALKLEETFAADGAILHEIYFDCLGGTGEVPDNAFTAKVKEDFGSWEAFVEDATATAMAARGWVVTAYDPSDGKVRNFLCDVHNHGGVWGTVPLWTIDCYEHAYFIDYGADRKAYVAAVFENVDWDAVNARFEKAVA